MARIAAERLLRTQPHPTQHRSPDRLPPSSRPPSRQPLRARCGSSSAPLRHRPRYRPGGAVSSAIRCCGPSASPAPDTLFFAICIQLSPPRRSDRKDSISRLRPHATPALKYGERRTLLARPCRRGGSPRGRSVPPSRSADLVGHQLRPPAAQEPQDHPSDVQLEESVVIQDVSSEGAGSGPSVLAYPSRLRARTDYTPLLV